jgi:hypothetical protein
MEGAAGAFSQAAYALHGRRDERALLESARCLLAIGEAAPAERLVQSLLLSGGDAAVVRELRLLGAQIAAFRHGSLEALEEILQDLSPEMRSFHPAALFTLHRVSGAEIYRERLLRDHASSPEAQILRERVSLYPAAHWFLYPGMEDTLLSPQGPEAGASAAALPEASALSGADALAEESLPEAIALQVGLYHEEANAQAMVERLAAAGLKGEVVRRPVNGYWAVLVPPGSDLGRTIIQLKDQGIEAFPVYP